MKKLLPYPLVYINHIEKWLNQMSLDGYHLIKLNSLFATFEEGCYKDIKYSIVFYKSKDNHDVETKYIDEEDYKSKYVENSWELLQNDIQYNNINLFKEPNYCSIYKSITDTPGKISIKKLSSLIEPTKRMSGRSYNLSSFMFSTACTFLSFAISMSFSTYYIDHFYLRLIRIIPLSILSILFLYKGIKLNRLTKYYEEKKSLPKRPMKSHSLLTIILVTLCIFVMIYVNPERLSTTQKDAYLGEIDNLITLEVIEGEHNSYLQDEYLDDYYDGYSDYAPFMPLHYELEENTNTKENNHTYVSLDVNYTKAYFNPMLNRLTKGWPIFYSNEDHGEIQETSTSYFYEIKYYQRNDDYDKGEAPSYYMLFRSKYELIDIKYTGNRTPDEIIENIEELYSKQ